MSSFSRHIIVGNVGQNPETKQLDSGNSVCKFSVAVNRVRGENEYTTWYNVDAWGKLGEICQNYLTAGRLVGIESDRLEAFAWVDDDGNAKASLQLTAREVHLLGSRSSGAQQGQEEEQPPW